MNEFILDKIMKTLKSLSLLFCLMLSITLIAVGQPGKLPPFRMMRSNGNAFKAQDLPIGKPVIIIYFSPDCDHCNTFMEAFFKQPATFTKASVAMITYLPVGKLAEFDTKYELKKYPNIYSGTEGYSFFVRDYYKLSDIPFAALYDKTGNLIKSYSKSIPLAELSDKLRALK